jgi:hypothetical protein
MSVVLRQAPPLADMLHITSNLRARDFDEISATRFVPSRQEFAQRLAEEATYSGNFRWIAYRDGIPVAAIGATPRWPHVWSVWAFGTTDWPRVVLSLTKHVRRVIIPALYATGARRADCMALSTHEDARRWLEHLGAAPEKTMDNWGKNGESFVLYCWAREHAKALISQS